MENKKDDAYKKGTNYSAMTRNGDDKIRSLTLVIII